MVLQHNELTPSQNVRHTISCGATINAQRKLCSGHVIRADYRLGLDARVSLAMYAHIENAIMIELGLVERMICLTDARVLVSCSSNL